MTDEPPAKRRRLNPRSDPSLRFIEGWITMCRVHMPSHIVDYILGFLPRNHYVLQTSGMVCIGFRELLLQSWKHITMDPSKSNHIPNVVLRSAHKVSFGQMPKWKETDRLNMGSRFQDWASFIQPKHLDLRWVLGFEQRLPEEDVYIRRTTAELRRSPMKSTLDVAQSYASYRRERLRTLQELVRALIKRRCLHRCTELTLPNCMLLTMRRDGECTYRKLFGLFGHLPRLRGLHNVPTGYTFADSVSPGVLRTIRYNLCIGCGIMVKDTSSCIPRIQSLTPECVKFKRRMSSSDCGNGLGPLLAMHAASVRVLSVYCAWTYSVPTFPCLRKLKIAINNPGCECMIRKFIKESPRLDELCVCGGIFTVSVDQNSKMTETIASATIVPKLMVEFCTPPFVLRTRRAHGTISVLQEVYKKTVPAWKIDSIRRGFQYGTSVVRSLFAVEDWVCSAHIWIDVPQIAGSCGPLQWSSYIDVERDEVKEFSVEKSYCRLTRAIDLVRNGYSSG